MSRQYETSTAPLAGVRVLANLGVMLTHIVVPAGMLMRGLYQQDAYGALHHGWVMRMSIGLGGFGMEAFFIMTGLFASLGLIPALEKSGTSTKRTILAYYKKKVVRILPAVYSSLALAYFVLIKNPCTPDTCSATAQFVQERFLPPMACPAALPFNLLFVSNYLFPASCTVWTWSLDGQMQFFMLLPLFFMMLRPQRAGFRTRVVLASAAVALLSTVAMFAQAYYIHLPLPADAFASLGDFDALMDTVKLIQSYTPLHVRLTPYALGIILAVTILGGNTFQRQFHAWCTKYAVFYSAIMTAAAYIMYTVFTDFTSFSDGIGPKWSRLRSAFASIGLNYGPIPAMAVSCILFDVLFTPCRMSTSANRLLSARLWKMPAELSYATYLMHFLVLMCLLRIAPTTFTLTLEQPKSFFVATVVYLAATYATAWAFSAALDASLLAVNKAYSTIHRALLSKKAQRKTSMRNLQRSLSSSLQRSLSSGIANIVKLE